MQTKDIIKLLPLDEKFKMELLNEFDFLDPDEKFEIEQVLWKAYRDLYEAKLKDNMQLALQKAGNNQEKLDKGFYKRIREQTDKELEEEERQTIEQTDLFAARTAMEKIVKEIRAAKKDKLASRT